MKLKTVLAAPLITAMLFNSLPSFASDTSSAFTPEQEKRIGEIAADYMRAHPDILIQMSESLQQEQQEKQARGLKNGRTRTTGPDKWRINASPPGSRRRICHGGRVL